jgi:hypothetical protein
LQELLSEHGLRAPVLLMTAEGGVVPIDSARERPVSLLDSGPVGGTLGSHFVGRSYDEPNIICTDVGGTSFDALYVNVNGQSGYFDRSLDAYGQEGMPCSRCGTAIRREPFMNRSSFSCPRCQPRPRANSR